ncbi:MAG: hypothetical protein WC856_15030 [Methylococcaceae bacterium]|jgi:hypothetical protein
MVKIDAVNAFCMFLSRLGVTGFLGLIRGALVGHLRVKKGSKWQHMANNKIG